MKDRIITAAHGVQQQGDRRTVATLLVIATAIVLCVCGCGNDASRSRAVEDMRRAAASKNFCDLAAALHQPAFRGNDGAAVVATYTTFDRAVNAATGFVPSELAAKWPAIVKGADAAAKQAERTNGDLADPRLFALLTAGEFRAAYDAVDAWVADHC